ncbi:MAG: bile acid:sodium symporter family protein [Gammaproteobacteria bacterium]|nr:bile acid:sodium symporter family protein [Gammaproteobacteria bacterium]
MTWVVQYFLPGAVIAIMFAVGLDLAPRDFARVFKYPRAALVGLTGQLVFLPALGFLLAMLVKDDPTLAIGIILLAACPGGVTSNMVSYLARAHTALSVSFTAVTSVVSFITIPLIVNWGLAAFGEPGAEIRLPVLATMEKVFLLTILPVLVGMSLRALLPGLVGRIEPYLQRVSSLLLIAILGVIFTLNWDLFIEQFWRYAPFAVAMTMVAGGAGYFAAKAAGLDRRDKFTISIEVGFQNISLAQLIAATILGKPEYGLLAAIYPFANWVPLLPWLLYFRHRSNTLAAGEA